MPAPMMFKGVNSTGKNGKDTTASKTGLKALIIFAIENLIRFNASYKNNVPKKPVIREAIVVNATPLGVICQPDGEINIYIPSKAPVHMLFVNRIELE